MHIHNYLFNYLVFSQVWILPSWQLDMTGVRIACWANFWWTVGCTSTFWLFWKDHPSIIRAQHRCMRGYRDGCSSESVGILSFGNFISSFILPCIFWEVDFDFSSEYEICEGLLMVLFMMVCLQLTAECSMEHLWFLSIRRKQPLQHYPPQPFMVLWSAHLKKRNTSA